MRAGPLKKGRFPRRGPRAPNVCTASAAPISGGTPMEEAPARFTIRPDDYHVPYAGTAEDGRRFFLSEELFSDTSAWVGLFLWTAGGQFDEVRVSAAGRAPGLPPGQAAPADPGGLVQARLAELGKHVLEPITVEPFTTRVDGTEFGWKAEPLHRRHVRHQHRARRLHLLLRTLGRLRVRHLTAPAPTQSARAGLAQVVQSRHCPRRRYGSRAAVTVGSGHTAGSGAGDARRGVVGPGGVGRESHGE